MASLAFLKNQYYPTLVVNIQRFKKRIYAINDLHADPFENLFSFSESSILDETISESASI